MALAASKERIVSDQGQHVRDGGGPTTNTGGSPDMANLSNTQDLSEDVGQKDVSRMIRLGS